MKRHLATAAAALFLFAAPGIGLAQETGGTGTGNDTGGTAGQNQGGTTNNGTSDTAGGGNGGNGGDNCPEVTANQNFDQLSEKCRAQIISFVESQTGASVVYEGDVAVGTVLPDTVTFVEVPGYGDYGYVMLNDRRVLVNRSTRTVVHVF